MTSSVDPYKTAPIGAVLSWSTLFASILKLVVFGNYLQQTTSSDIIFQMHFFWRMCSFKYMFFIL